jgi:hypothetical protein
MQKVALETLKLKQPRCKRGRERDRAVNINLEIKQ